MAAALRPKPGQTILVDLTTATFVDSTVISWLVGIANRAAETRADVVVRAGPGAVRRVLEISGVTRYIPLAEVAVQPAIRLPAGSAGA